MTALRLLLLVSALALTGCEVSRTAAADPVEYDLEQTFSLSGGHEAVIRGEQLRLRFTDVLEDSRCPSRVLCVWTGQARIAVLVEQAGREPSTAEFNTNPGLNAQSAQAGSYTIALTALDPYPQTPEQSIDLADYRATLSVRRT